MAANGNEQTAAAAPNGVPTLTSVHRVTAIPVVSDTINQIHAVVNSTNVTTKAYAIAEGLVKSGYSLAEPVLGYGGPVLKSADGLANKGLDFAEARFPYPFQTKTETMVADARKPADQAFGLAKDVYDTRIAPYQDNAIVQKAIDTVNSINQGLSSRYNGTVQKVHDISGDASAKLHALSSVLLEQLGELQKQGSNLPSVAKENLAKAYGDLSAVLKTDKPIADKTKDVVHFVHESLQPILDSAWKIISATKEKAEQTAEKAQSEGQDTLAYAEDKAGKTKKATKQKGQETKKTAEETLQQ
jgi:ElaB/YqjD/DUF883 family membrane-anchored ribosome-binding protein